MYGSDKILGKGSAVVVLVIVAVGLGASPPDLEAAAPTVAKTATPAPSPAVKPPAVKPPAVKPPAVKPPAVKPPAVKPPAVKPPAVKPPAVKPPAVKPPAVKPPAVKPPAVKPPAVKPPAVKPPAVKPPAVKPPAVKPPVVQPPRLGQSSNRPPANRPPLVRPTVPAVSVQSETGARAASPAVRRVDEPRLGETKSKDIRAGDVRREALADRMERMGLGGMGASAAQAGDRAGDGGVAGQGPAGDFASEITDALSNRKQGREPVDIGSLGSNRQRDAGKSENRGGMGEQFGLSDSSENPGRNSSQLQHSGFGADSRLTADEGNGGGKGEKPKKPDNGDEKPKRPDDKDDKPKPPDGDTQPTTKPRERTFGEKTEIFFGKVWLGITKLMGGEKREEPKGTNVAVGVRGTPNPMDEGGGQGKTWDQLTPAERAEIRRAGEAKRQSLVNPGPEGAGTTAPAELEKTDARTVMGQKQNPYINPGESGGGKAIPGGPSTGSVAPGSAVDTLGGDSRDPLGAGGRSGGAGNPLEPEPSRSGGSTSPQ